MPTYDYHCTACGHRFEEWQQISDPKLKKCPKCRKPKLERLVGAGAGLIFRGTGFYVTDYKRKGSSGGSESSESGGAKGGEAKGSKGAADSGAAGKPAAKPSDAKSS
jgi:putative FmdB family regulatory protein